MDSESATLISCSQDLITTFGVGYISIKTLGGNILSQQEAPFSMMQAHISFYRVQSATFAASTKN